MQHKLNHMLFFGKNSEHFIELKYLFLKINKLKI